MTRSLRPSRLLRIASLLVLGELALHELRYVLAYGDKASTELAQQGHSYLIEAGPILVVGAVALIAARLLAAASGSIDRGRCRPALLVAAAGLAAGLLATYAAQETAEGVFTTGHPEGLAGIFGGGGWIAVPLALLIGAIAAVLDRALDGAEVRLAARVRRRQRHPRSANRRTPAPPCRIPLELEGLAFGLARRPPPPARSV
jgi:hypothetical protein